MLFTFTPDGFYLYILSCKKSRGRKRNEMRGVVGHICALRQETGETPDGGEMKERALPSRHMIPNSSWYVLSGAD